MDRGGRIRIIRGRGEGEEKEEEGKNNMYRKKSEAEGVERKREGRETARQPILIGKVRLFVWLRKTKHTRTQKL